MVEWYQQWNIKGLGEEPVAVSLFSANSPLNGEDQNQTRWEASNRLPEAWHRLLLFLLACNTIHSLSISVLLTGQVLASYLSLTHPLPSITDPPTYIKSEVKSFQMSNSSRYHSTFVSEKCGMKFWEGHQQSCQWLLMVLSSPSKQQLEWCREFGKHCFLQTVF